MSKLWVMMEPKTERWSEPQAGPHYPWLAVYWKAGTPEPTATFQPGAAEIVLRPCDGFFGPEGRKAFSQPLQHA
jgi:hypothetical protein